MIEWHGYSILDYWKNVDDNSCNRVNGNDPGDLPMNIHPGDNITAFIGQLCRKLTFNYQKEVRITKLRKANKSTSVTN